MSKKKVMPRSTMTLKDFHGGSIPSDLQLPSAPGMTVDRSAYERQGPNAWINNSLNRGYGGDRGGYHRQGPMNGIRTFEDKASYFPNPANIGRNYDEDERRPVDSRPGGDRYEDYGRGGLDKIGYSGALNYVDPRGPALSDRHASQTREHDNGASYKGQLSRSPERLQYSSYQSVGRFASQQSSASSPRTMSEPPPNVWTARREGDQGRGRSGEADAAVVSPWRVRNNIARIAEASAIDKVSSGRWQPDHNRSVVTNLDRKNADSPYPADVFDARKDSFEAPHSSGHGPEAFNSWKAENHHTFDNRKLENFHSSQGFESRVSLGTDTWQSPNLHPSSERGFGSSDVHTEAENAEAVHGERRFTSDRPSNVRAGYNDGGRSSYIDTGKAAYIRPYTDSGSRVGASDVQGGGVSDSGRLSSGYTAYNDHRTGGTDSFRGAYSEPSDQRYAETPVDYSEARLSNAPRSMNREDFHGCAHGGYDRLEAHSEVGHADDRNGRFSYSMEMDAQDSHRHYAAQSDYRNVTGNRQGHYLAGNDGATKMLPNRESVGSGPKSMLSDDGLRVPYNSDGLQRQYSSEWERNRSPPKQEFNYQSSSHASTMVGSTYSDSGKSGAALLRSDSGERPKLKLLPRSKPVENSSEQISKEPVRPEVELWTENQEGLDKRGIAYESNVEQAEAEQDLHRHSERPKLNLKPRTQLVEGVAATERKNLFGGARPRELVLKERGADDAVIVGVEAVSTPVASDANRLTGRDLDVVRTERKDRWSDVKQEGRQFERHDNRSYERQASSRRQDGNNLERQDSGKGFNRREQDTVRNDQDRYDNRRDFGRQDRRDHEKQDVAKRDIDKQESWRRPVDPPPQCPSPVVSALAEVPSRTPGKYGVGASALELAQAFSRSTSLTRTSSQSRSPGRRLYGAKEASEFSRLTDVPSPGYGGGERRNNGKLGSYDQRDSGFSGNNDFLGRRGLPVRSREGY